MKLVRIATLAALTLAAAVAAASAAPTSFTVDKAHSEIGFDVRHMFSKVHGRFNDFAGTIAYDAANPASISVDASADARTIWTDNEQRDKHLRSADFFNADSFPAITFKSTKVTAAGKGRYKVAGDLTMHGVTRPVVFDGEFLGEGPMMVGGQNWGYKAGFTATTVVNRKDFGIVWNKTLDNGSLMLSDDVTLTLNIEADKAK